MTTVSLSMKQVRVARQRGISLIEVMVTVIVLIFGLGGLVALQARMQISEMESYQRSQALLLAQDMANRMALNRQQLAFYDGSSITSSNCPTTTATAVQRDLAEWCQALQGAAEKQSGTSVGALIGGRGCIKSLTGSGYMITVA